MNKIIGLSATLISLSILLIAGILFYHYIDDQVGGLAIVFSFFGALYFGFLLIKETLSK